MNATLQVRLRPSRVLAAAIVVSHLAALGAAIVALPAVAAGVVAIGLALSATEHVRRALLRAPLAVAGLSFSADGGLAVAAPDGEWCSGSLRGAAVPAAWFAVVAIRDGLGRRRTAVVLPDALDAEAFRRLRVWLRWRTGATQTAERSANAPTGR